MSDEAIQFGLMQDFSGRGGGADPDKKIYGVAVAVVRNNMDLTGAARVQLELPWMPGVMPWARMSTLLTGTACGSLFIPPNGAEVLIAFNQGDVREPYVLGMLWNTIDSPPTVPPTEVDKHRLIRTQFGNSMEFDDVKQSITISTLLKSTVTLDPGKAEISTPTAKVTVNQTGDITISAKTKLTLEGTVIEIKATGGLTLNGATVNLKANGNCVIAGSAVAIN